MRLYADLHIHSKYSRACSRDCDLEHLAWWAGRKGIDVVGTGDFTHPGWIEELRTGLVEAEPGLFRLRPELECEVLARLPPACRTPVRFLLSSEISTIYKRDERTRKVHHLLYAPDFDSVAEITRQLDRIGNLASDGRPILGLDSRDLLEITLGGGDGCYLVPAHIWTPWFAALGSQSGFDAIEDCYADLAGAIFAVETGLSSDPEMNWRVSGLDRYRLVSNSDAHSPPILGREATVFDIDLDYFSLSRALRTGEGFGGTIELYPEEGKYHLDGHRACGVRTEPGETQELAGRCPVCAKPLTVGVLHRVDTLADREVGQRPAGAGSYRSFVPLPEMIGEIAGVGPKSKTVRQQMDALVGRLGPELAILGDLPLDEVATAGSSLLVEALDRLRRGEVRRQAGYDGVYGTIRLFAPGELAGATLFALGAPDDAPRPPEALGSPPAPARLPPTDPDPGPAPEPVAVTAGTAPVSDEPPIQAALGLHDVPARAGAASDGPVQPTVLGAGADVGSATAGEVHLGAAAAAALAFPTSDDPAPAPAAASILDGLDPDQRRVASLGNGPVLVVAGPGTGKTRVLTHRLAQRIAHGSATASGCLAVTFTRRACDELRQRLEVLVPEHAPQITVTTFHGLGLLIVREQHDRLGLAPDLRVADETTCAAVVADVEDCSATDARRLATLMAARKRARGDTAGGEPDDLDDAVRRYEAALHGRGYVDFDDLIALPVAVLEGDQDLAGRYQARWPDLYVDEYQDVDGLQYRLLRALSRPDGNLCAIGDPDQAIYSFRGGDVGYFLRFQEDFPAARVVQLTRNYRSAPTIVRAALEAIAPSTLVPDRVLTPARTDIDDGPISAWQTDEATDEAEVVATTIEALLGGTSFFALDRGAADGGVHHQLSFSDFAVLARTSAQSEPVIEALARRGFPVQRRSHQRLSDRPEVQAVVAALGTAAGAAPAGGSVSALVRVATALVLEQGTLAAGTVAAVPELLGPLAVACGADLQRFLTELALGVEVDTWDPRAERIAMLTLHAAKGLEFPVVFIVGCEDGMLPLRHHRGDDGSDEAEERRLLFVGMTRATHRLVLTAARCRLRWGAVEACRLSPFLDAIGPSRLHWHRGRDEGRDRSPARQLRLL